MFDGKTSVIDTMGDDRGAGICTQFWCIFVRNVQYVTRSPRALHGVAFQGIFMGIVLLLLYNGVGVSFTDFDKVDSDPYYAAKFQQYIFNLSGLSLMLSNSIAFGAGNSVIL